MNSKITFWMVLAAGLLFAYIYFVELSGANAARSEQANQKLLPHFNPSRVSSIEITHSNQTVRAEFINGQWQLTSPNYPAQSTAIAAFLDALAGLNRLSEISAADIVSQEYGLSPFGLDPPSANIKVQEGPNVIQLRVGSKTLIGDRVYVQPAGASGIFITEASLLEHVPASKNDWRNPLLINLSELDFDQISITAGRSLRLERDKTNQLWHLVEPWPMRADFDRVQTLLRELGNARVSQFVTDDPRVDLEPYGLQTPDAELSLSLGSNIVYQLQIGKSPTNDPGQVYARRLTQTNVVLVSRDLTDLVKQNFTEFRDRTLVSLPRSGLDSIEVHADEAFALQHQTNGQWQIVAPFQAAADQQLMNQFVDDLARMEIIEFKKDAVPDFAPYGLQTPARQYVLKSVVATASPVATNQTIVQFGANPTNEFGKAEWDKIYCRRADENSVYVLRSSDMGNLPKAAFQIRDRHIWHFESTNVVSFNVVQSDSQRLRLRDAATGAWVKNDLIQTAEIEETLHRLGEVQVDYWVGIGDTVARQCGTGSNTFQLTFNLKENGQTRQLNLAFGRLAMSGQMYAAAVLEQQKPVVFKFPAKLYEGVVHYLGIPTPDNSL
jgi:hypothetical protein